jgi:hypothetical protein
MFNVLGRCGYYTCSGGLIADSDCVANKCKGMPGCNTCRQPFSVRQRGARLARLEALDNEVSRFW